MGRSKSADIDTVPKRAKLAPRKNPYWIGISGGRGGVSLGYRKPARGHGTWIAKIVLNGQRLEEKIGGADDDGAPHGALTYRRAVAAALDWSRQQHAAIEASQTLGRLTGPTVAIAVHAYIKARSARSERDGKIAEGRLTKHVLNDATFSKTPLSKLRASTIEAWRERLANGEIDGPDEASATPQKARKPLSPSSVNRLLNDLRAALNASAEAHRRELPAFLPAEIKVGTKAGQVPTEARKQLLTDAQVRTLIEAAFEVDPDGDFGRLVLLAASTGARFSQIVRIKVGALQPEKLRVMVPGSHKGRAATARPAVAVPLTAAVVDQLRPAFDDRQPDEPLLTRWAYRNVGPFKWEKDRRRPWGPAHEINKPWAATIAKAELPADTIMYALRHSSIIRGLRAGLPVRLVASLHDTSTEMIEKHYSAFIVDMTEDLARKSAFAP